MKWAEGDGAREKVIDSAKLNEKKTKTKCWRYNVSVAVSASSNDCAWETSQLLWNMVRTMVFLSLSAAQPNAIGLCRRFKCYGPLQNCYINLNTHSTNQPTNRTHQATTAQKDRCRWVPKAKTRIFQRMHCSIKGKRARSKISNK